MRKPTYAGFGTLQQVGALIGILGALYSIQNTRDAERTNQAAAQGAQREIALQGQRADTESNTRFQRVWDYLPSMRRDIEADYRRDIDSACRCCR